MADVEPVTPAIDFDHPAARLIGELNAAAACQFLDALAAAPESDAPIVVEVTTPGGDAELGRRLGLEIERLRKKGRRVVFVGKSQCYSAGTSVMAGFPVRDRYLTRDCRLLIHSRQLDKRVEVSGPLQQSLAQVEAIAAEIRVGAELEEEGFAKLIEGSDITLEEVKMKAPANWYLTAEEALARHLIAGLV